MGVCGGCILDRIFSRLESGEGRAGGGGDERGAVFLLDEMAKGSGFFFFETGFRAFGEEGEWQRSGGRAAATVFFIFIFFKKKLQKYIFHFTFYISIPLPPGRGR
jgi:hypothetical protein